jgi:dTDP-4-dehydrorhamnose reductase
MQTVLILGATGMLGSAVLREFSTLDCKLIATVRNLSEAPGFPVVEFIEFDATSGDLNEALGDLKQVDYVINCIGLIKTYIDDSVTEKREMAILINAVFPYTLEAWAAARGAKVIQIATDCVFSGSKGKYLESDKHDALDVYGKSKSLGEVPSSSMMHIRVSIIGPEVNRSSSLLEWVRNQPENAEISGFTDHKWNGITSLHFAKIARGVITDGSFEAGVIHVLPEDSVTKFELVKSMASHLGRSDVKISPKDTGDSVDRTLGTIDSDKNSALWQGAGYSSPPTVNKMVEEMIKSTSNPKD